MQVAVGRVGRAHGVGGEVFVDVLTDDPDRRLAVGSRLATDPETAGPVTIAGVRPHSGRLLIRFDGLQDRTAAEALRGAVLLADVDPSERPGDPDDFYDHHLVGLRVFSRSGAFVGEVGEMLHLPGQDLVSLRRPDGRQVLIPFVAALVPEVDLTSGRMVVEPPPGLLDDEG